MANKKISELESRASLSLSDLMAVGDPSTGYLYKTTISDLKTLTGAGVVSFNGRFGTVNPAEGDYTLTQLGDVIITTPSNAQVLQYNGSNWVNSSLNLTTTLAALTDVAISSIANNQLLRYNSTSQKWENWTPNYLTSYTETDTLNSVTGRGNTTTNDITVGSVTAAGLSNLLGQIKTFVSTGNTYIGASPASASDAGYKLDVNGTVRISNDLTMWDDGTNNGNSRALILRALGSTGNVQTGQIILDGFGASGQDYMQLSASNLRLAPTSGTVTITGTTPSISTVAASGFRLTANSTTNGFIFTQSYNQTSGDLFAVFTNSNQKKFSIAASDSSVTIASLAGTGSRMIVADANGVLSTQAIPSLSGYVTLDTFQTITASKTFSVGFSIASAGGSNQISSFANTNSIHSGSAGSNIFGFNSSNNIYFGKGLSNGGVIGWNNSAVRSYTLPDATGTIALTSDIPSLSNYVTLDGTQTITGLKTFSGLLTANGNIKATYYGFADSNGYSTGFESQSNNTIQVKIGSGLAINIASNNNTTFYGNIIRNGGTSSQFLKADGSLDSSTYLTSSSVAGVYLPLSGGTLTGALNGTTATFSGSVTSTGNAATNSALILNNNIGGGGAAQYYADFTAGATVIARMLRGNGASGLEANGLNIDNFSGFKVRLNQLGGSGGIFTIDGGNVAINTTSAPERLTVAGNVRSSGYFMANDGTRDFYLNPGANLGFGALPTVQVASNHALQFATNNSLRLNIAASGEATFYSSVDTAGRVLAGSAGNTSNAFSGINNSVAQATIYAFNHSASGYAFFSGQGINYFANNVGIGTTNPLSRLHVEGSIRTVLTSGAGGDTLFSAIAGASNGYRILVDTSNNITYTWHTGTNVNAMTITSAGDVKVRTLEVTNATTYGASSGISTYMQITVNGQNYVIPLHGTP